MENDMKKSNTADAAGSVPDPTANAAPDPAAEVPAPRAHDNAIEAWFAKHFHNLGPMLDTRLYNHIRAAVEDLKAEFHKL